uniref:Uncharacterized protein n=1 Tax=Arundo donax TaxID=35708 RepID=A0A0A9C374_ARUDO
MWIFFDESLTNR